MFSKSLILPVVKAHSKDQGILCLVLLLKTYKLYTMVKGSTVYSLLDCTSGCHHIVMYGSACAILLRVV